MCSHLRGIRVPRLIPDMVQDVPCRAVQSHAQISCNRKCRPRNRVLECWAGRSQSSRRPVLAGYLRSAMRKRTLAWMGKLQEPRLLARSDNRLGDLCAIGSVRLCQGIGIRCRFSLDSTGRICSRCFVSSLVCCVPQQRRSASVTKADDIKRAVV
jgi:hypothetical protein